jgi:hypothetical protein
VHMSILSQPNLPTPLLVSEKSKKVAKVTPERLMKTEKSDLWGELGKCLVFVCYDAELSIKEFAAKIGKDAGQVQRQMEGKERPQIEAVFAIPEFRAPLVIALSRISPNVECLTEIRVRRTA